MHVRVRVSLGATDRGHYEAATARGVQRAQQCREYLTAKYLDLPLASTAALPSDIRRRQFYELEHGFVTWLQSRAPIDADAESLFEFDAVE